MRQTLEEEKQINDITDDNLFSEDALEMASMSAKERRAYKKELRKKRLDSMEGKEKRKYILYYYKWYFIGVVFAIAMCIYIGKTIYTASLPTELIVAVTNDGTNAFCEQYIPDAFREYYQLGDKNTIQVFDNLTIENPDDVRVQESTLTDYEKIMVYISSDRLDAIIGNSDTLNYYKSTGDIAIVDQCMPEELYQQLESYIVDVTDSTGYMNDGKPYAAAIDISQTDFVKQCQLSYDDVYLMIPNNRYMENDATLRLIRMIFDLPDETETE